MKQKTVLLLMLLCGYQRCFCWGFYAHKEINYHAVFLLPPAMMVFYKPNIDFIKEHAVDPDKRRYAVNNEAPRHYIDLNRYGNYPFEALPRDWHKAVEKLSEDSLQAHGIVPWWISTMLHRLTMAFRENNSPAILKLSAEIGHYIADAHVPLHAHSNYNGQQTGQHGIHGLWETRIPELIAASEFSYFIGRAEYIKDPQTFIWQRVLESAAAADTVLQLERELSLQFKPDRKYAYEIRNGLLTRQYSSGYTVAYNSILNGMVERRMRQAIFATASLWYTAWINAGQPDLQSNTVVFTEEDNREFEEMDRNWKQTMPAETCGN